MCKKWFVKNIGLERKFSKLPNEPNEVLIKGLRAEKRHTLVQELKKRSLQINELQIIVIKQEKSDEQQTNQAY